MIFLIVEVDDTIALHHLLLIDIKNRLWHESIHIRSIVSLVELYALAALISEDENVRRLLHNSIFRGLTADQHKRVVLNAEISRHTCRIGKVDRVALHTKSNILTVLVKPNALQVLFAVKSSVGCAGLSCRFPHEPAMAASNKTNNVLAILLYILITC